MSKQQKEKRPSRWHPIARANWDGSMRSYREIQARILPKDESEEYDVSLPEEWKQQPAQWLLRSLGLKKGLPPGSGAGLVQSQYADLYTRIYGTVPIADLPKYRTIYRTQPDVQGAVEIQVNLAIGKGFTIKHPEKKVVDYLLKVCNDINLLQHMLVMTSDMLVYGNSYTEILWNEKIEKTEQMYEYKGVQYTKDEIETLKVNPKEIKVAQIDYDGQQRNFVAQKIKKGEDARILGLKDLDPIYLRVRRDSWGNIFGYIQWMAFPPVLIDNDSLIHIRFRPKSTGYESAYGVSILMPLIKNNDLLNQFENDAAVWIHSRAVPPLIVKGGSPERPYSLIPSSKIIAFNDCDLHLDSFEKFAEFEGVTDKNNIIHPTKDISVPSFNKNNEVVLQKVYGIVKHKYTGDIYKIKTTYNKEISTTAGHSLFKWQTNYKHPFMEGNKGKIVPYPIDSLKVGDYIAISTKLPIVEQNKTKISVLDLIENKWNVLVRYTDEEWVKYKLDEILSIPIGFNQFTQGNKKTKVYMEVKNLLKTKYHSNKPRRNKTKRIIKRIKKEKKMPYPVFEILQRNINLPIGKITTTNKRPGKSESLPLEIKITNDLLWVLGMFIAEGCNKETSTSFASDDYNVLKIKEILDSIGFKTKKDNYYKVPNRTGKFGSCPPTVNTHSLIFRNLLKYLEVKDKRVPTWILQLPLSKSKWFLKGLYDGDGNHNSKNTQSFGYSTSNKDLAEDIVYLLLRFGVISGIKSSKTEYGTNSYFVYATVNTTNFEQWDKIKVQTKNGNSSAFHLENEVALVKVKSIKKYPVKDEWVYDFQVEDTENFVGGLGIFCHNSTAQMKELMSILKSRTAASMIFAKADVQFEELKTVASDMDIQWWINYLLTRRYQALGIPPLFMGIAEKGGRATAEVLLHDFITRLQVLQELVADPIEEFIFKPLIKAEFGEDVENAEMVWKPIIEEDRNMRAQRLIQMLQAGAISINEARSEMGFATVPDKPEYDEMKPVEPAFTPKGFPPKPGAVSRPPAEQVVPKTTPEEKLKLEKTEKVKRMQLLQIEDSFREKMLNLVKKIKSDLRVGDKLTKVIKEESLENAKSLINENVVSSYLVGRAKANAALGQEDDLILKQEDLTPISKMKTNFLSDFNRIVEDMVKMKEEGVLQ